MKIIVGNNHQISLNSRTIHQSNSIKTIYGPLSTLAHPLVVYADLN